MVYFLIYPLRAITHILFISSIYFLNTDFSYHPRRNSLLTFREVIFCLQVPSVSRVLMFSSRLEHPSASPLRQFFPCCSSFSSTRPRRVFRLASLQRFELPSRDFYGRLEAEEFLKSRSPDSGEGSVSRVHVSAAYVARSLLQHAALALRLLLQGDVLDL